MLKRKETVNQIFKKWQMQRVMRIQWTREQKLEFVELFKKYGNKSKAAKEFESCYKLKLNSRTYNRWVTKESKIRDSKHCTKKTGCGRKAFYPEMEAKLYKEFHDLREWY